MATITSVSEVILPGEGSLKQFFVAGIDENGAWIDVRSCKDEKELEKRVEELDKIDSSVEAIIYEAPVRFKRRVKLHKDK